MNLRAALFFVLAVLATACSRPPEGSAAPAPAAALQGAYRANNGELLTFSPNGSVLGTARRGSFTADGNSVTLTMGATVIPGERSSSDVLVFRPPGRPPATFYRLGSVAAQTAAASPVRAPAGPPKPSPDRNVPLERYTPINDRTDLRTIVLAFAQPPPSDDQLSALIPEAAGATDAFARRDVFSKHRAELDARLDAARQQRYYRIDAVAMPRAQLAAKADALTWDWTEIRLGEYDFATKSFSIPCFQTSSLRDETTQTDSAFDALDFVMDPNARCSLSVPDEAMAKAIESARSKAPLSAFRARAALYFFVSDARVSYPNIVRAVLTHIDLTLLDPADTRGFHDVAHLSFDP